MKTYLRLPLVLLAVFSLASCTIHQCPSDCALPPQSSFDEVSFHARRTNQSIDVFASRTDGAPMLILHELGGLNPCTLAFGEAQSRKGWKVYLPALDSDYGMCDVIKHNSRIKKSQRWDARSPQQPGPILDDLEEMVDWISARHHGQRVVVMGNCLTGAYPLALLARRSVKTAVLCQPAMPLKGLQHLYLGVKQPQEHQAALGLREEQFKAVEKALRDDPAKKVIGFHYLEDPLAPFEKFEAIHQRLGGRFHAVVMVPASQTSGSPWYERHVTTAPQDRFHPHSTVTGAENGIRQPGCRDREFFQKRFNELIRP